MGLSGAKYLMSLNEQVEKDLSSALDGNVVADLLSTYQALLTKHRAGDLKGGLIEAGRFVEHAFRALVGLQTGAAPAEIKSPADTMKKLENDTSLSEPIRLLIPRALYGMMYNLRSKRDAVHVKQIDPRRIDLAMATHCASWVIAELLRLYHVSDEPSVELAMASLMRTELPYIEKIGNERFVSKKVDARTEMLLLLADAASDGATRTELGKAAKCSASSVTNALKWLLSERLTHQTENGRYFITGTGEQHLAKALTAA